MSFGSVRRSLRSNTINSLRLTGDSHNSFAGSASAFSTPRGVRRCGSRGAPEPDVSVNKQLHREASQSSQVPLGPTMSPKILPVPTIDPSRLPVVSPGDGGSTSATGLPKRHHYGGWFHFVGKRLSSSDAAKQFGTTKAGPVGASTWKRWVSILSWVSPRGSAC